MIPWFSHTEALTFELCWVSVQRPWTGAYHLYKCTAHFFFLLEYVHYHSPNMTTFWSHLPGLLEDTIYINLLIVHVAEDIFRETPRSQHFLGLQQPATSLEYMPYSVAGIDIGHWDKIIVLKLAIPKQRAGSRVLQLSKTFLLALISPLLINPGGSGLSKTAEAEAQALCDFWLQSWD